MARKALFGPDNETAKEWNGLIDKKEVKKYPIDLWQANYSREMETGKKYKQIVKKARCTVYAKRLRLFDVMKTWSRYVISKLVQFRTGHALVGGWFKELGIQRDEGYNCDCGELETIQHIIPFFLFVEASQSHGVQGAGPLQTIAKKSASSVRSKLWGSILSVR
ncbi:hypothetical protein TRICI_000530 [Trichomonascus ciferrii]|uniref:Uncharacterized protein n=1 Tax=Trichomonascus ciferrii TaxID=44093 RepID=A0A642VD46_9ASCO|nr:hypothetical protein TRICI_000530 [Trichomonascus ciferrii]